jgi:hypothetical protein
MDFSSNTRIFPICKFTVFASVGYLNISLNVLLIAGSLSLTSMISYKYRKRTASALNADPKPYGCLPQNIPRIPAPSSSIPPSLKCVSYDARPSLPPHQSHQELSSPS